MKKITLLFGLVLSGCTTIHFDNIPGQASNENMGKEIWHHNWAMGMHESSEPILLNEHCTNSQWASIKTEVSPINALVGGATQIMGFIWNPKTVTVSCQ